MRNPVQNEGRVDLSCSMQPYIEHKMSRRIRIGMSNRNKTNLAVLVKSASNSSTNKCMACKACLLPTAYMRGVQPLELREEMNFHKFVEGGRAGTLFGLRIN